MWLPQLGDWLDKGMQGKGSHLLGPREEAERKMRKRLRIKHAGTEEGSRLKI